MTTRDYELERARREVARGMRARVTIRRPDPDAAPDPISSIVSMIVVYTGRAKVVAAAAQESTPEVVGHTATIQRAEVHLPVTEYRPQVVTDLVTIDAAVDDPDLVGRVMRVVARPPRSSATRCRLTVEEVVG